MVNNSIFFLVGILILKNNILFNLQLNFLTRKTRSQRLISSIDFHDSAIS